MPPDWRRWLLVRRSVSTPQALQAAVGFAPQDTTWATGVRVAGTRWVLDQLVDAATGEVGLEHDEVRSWTGWARQITLALGALARLPVLQAGAMAVAQLKKSQPPPPAVSPLTAFTTSRGLASQ